MNATRTTGCLAALALVVAPWVLVPPAHATNPGVDDDVVYVALSGATGRIAITDGTSTRLLTPHPGNVAQPTVAPDGRHIAFVRNNDVVVMDIDGRHQHVVVSVPGASPTDPGYSPDGTHLVYDLWDGSSWQIWSARANGTHRRRISDGTHNDTSPVWSPSGTQIAFTRTAPSGFDQVFVMDPDGSDATQVTVDAGGAGYPAYAPDGTLVYSASDGGPTHVFARTASGVVQLTSGSTSDENAAVAPADDAITFTRFESGTSHVWTMNTDGTDQHQLVAGDSAEPAWASVPVRCHGRWATIVGTPGADVLEGSTGNDVIAGLGGDDTIAGGWGDDVVCGGAGADTIHGYLGADHLYGGAGSDLVYGDPGADVLHGNRGADHVVGGVGPDRLFGDSGNDVLGARDHRRDERIACGPGDDRARWDHHRDPHPISC